LLGSAQQGVSDERIRQQQNPAQEEIAYGEHRSRAAGRGRPLPAGACSRRARRRRRFPRRRFPRRRCPRRRIWRGSWGGGCTGGDLAGSVAEDFTAVSPTCTVVSAIATGVTGTTAGITDATAGGRVTGWEGATIRMITDGMAIRITAIMATPSLTPVRLGTI